jgi:hypothetical protein
VSAPSTLNDWIDQMAVVQTLEDFDTDLRR